jgi:hypothetical protein
MPVQHITLPAGKVNKCIDYRNAISVCPAGSEKSAGAQTVFYEGLHLPTPGLIYHEWKNSI